MKNLIGAIGYLADLLEMLEKLRKIDCAQEFYEIFVNYIELLNNEALGKKDNKKFSRYYCKLYFERVFYDIRKYISSTSCVSSSVKSSIFSSNLSIFFPIAVNPVFPKQIFLLLIFFL